MAQLAQWPPQWVQEAFPAQTQQWEQQLQGGQQQQRPQTRPKRGTTRMTMMTMGSKPVAGKEGDDGQWNDDDE